VKQSRIILSYVSHQSGVMFTVSGTQTVTSINSVCSNPKSMGVL